MAFSKEENTELAELKKECGSLGMSLEFHFDVGREIYIFEMYPSECRKLEYDGVHYSSKDGELFRGWSDSFAKTVKFVREDLLKLKNDKR